MSRKLYSSEGIFVHLREVELTTVQTISEVCRKLGILGQIYYRWRKGCRRLWVDRVRQLKGLERENTRVKKLVADQALCLAILKAASPGNY
jgi:putative transposase